MREESRTPEKDAGVESYLLARGLKTEITSVWQMTQRDQIGCTEASCDCYPFVSFRCGYCYEIWFVHCQKNYRPRALCIKCLEEEIKLTNQVLFLATHFGLIELDLREWYSIYINGVGGKLNARAQVLTVECRRTIKVPCEADPVKLSRWGAYKRWYEARTGPRTLEEYPCCQEDGLPCRGWQPHGRWQGQRDTPVGNPDEPDSNHVPH